MTRHDHDRLWAAAIASEVEPCPDCEVLCHRPSRSGPLMDLPASTPWDLMPESFHAMLITHGVGARLGREHLCPPTTAELVPVEDEA